MGSPFCGLPWTHFKVTSDSYYCCCHAAFGTPAAQYRESAISFEDGILFALWNSSHFMNLRKTMSQGQTFAACGWDKDPNRCKSSCVGPKLFRCKNIGTEKQINNDAAIMKSIRKGETTVSHYPASIELWLDLFCNLNCKMCYLNPRRRRGLADQISLDLFADELKTFLANGRELILVGGEPTVSPQYERLLEIVRDASGAKIFIITNGHRLKLSVIPNLDLFHKINVSIDAACRKTYERIRCGGQWYHLIDNLEAMSRARNDQTLLTFSAVINGLNFKEMEDIVRIAKTFGANEIALMEIHSLHIVENRHYRSALSLPSSNGSIELKTCLEKAIITAKHIGVSGSFSFPSIGAFGKF